MKKIINEIEENLARLSAFTELNPRPVIEIDYDGNLLSINQSAINLFPTLKVKGAKHSYLSDLKTIIKFLKKEKKPFTREIKIQNEWFRQVFYYIPNFKLIHIYGSNISDRKKYEERLEKSATRYHALFEKMNYGYALQEIILDKDKKIMDYRFVDVNPAFEKLSKLKKNDIIGKTINQISKPKTKEEINVRKKYDKVALTGKPLYLEQYSGALNKHFELYVYKPNDNQIALIFSDITKRKKDEEEKNNFISIMSHELRNPLTPILANAQFINAMIAGQETDTAIKESMHIIEKQAKIMANLLNDILEVERLNRKKIKLKKSKINICEVVKNSVEASIPLVNTKHQKISVYFGKNPIYAIADPTRMEQVVTNLINNASKYTRHHGKIEVSCIPKHDAVAIIVKDNGMGMDRKKISKVFELFQGDGQSFMGVGGLGIGLNLVKQLVAMHKGTIVVRSKGRNKGSEFMVSIPVVKDALLQKNQTPLHFKNSQPTTHSASKVLIVEDNKDIRNTIAQILSQRGHTIKSTHEGLMAVKISKTFKPDAAVVDIGLPDINGYKVAKLLKQQHQKEKKHIKLIALTGYGQDKDKDLAKEAGFDYHITKPVDINYLMRLI